MPHISKIELDQRVNEELGKRLDSLIRDSGSQTRVNMFSELLTETEKIMLAKRIGILFLLKKGLEAGKISEILGISSSTANRFENALQSNKYRYTMQWIWQHSKKGKLHTLLEKLVRLAFIRRTQSFKKFVEEM